MSISPLARTLSIWLLLLSFGGLYRGQAQDGLINSAEKLLEDQSYEAALNQLDKALDRPLKQKNISRAYLLRSDAYIQLWQARMKGTRDLARWERGLIQAAEDHIKAQEYDIEGRYTSQITEQKRILRPMLLEEALGYLNQAYRLQDLQQSRQILINAQQYLESAESIYPDYLSHDLMGQTLLLKADSLGALDAFRHAITQYEKGGPVIPDILIAYAYYRGALIEKQHNRNLDAALFLLDRGKGNLREDFKRMLELGGNIRPDQLRRMETQYQQAIKDLTDFEMKILLTYPTRRTRALVELRGTLEENPKDYETYLHYARLLEIDYPDKAEKAYQDAIRLQPRDTRAYFQLGMLHLDAANRSIDRAQQESEMDLVERYEARARRAMEEAKPLFEMVYSLRPQDLQTLRALIQICIYTEDQVGYRRYKDAQAALKD